MAPIVLATANPHKIAELRAIFDAHDIPVVGLADLPQPPGGFREPTESGRTFEENATLKALAYAAQTSRVCLADDSGLEIDALQGRPGVISSHYSTDGRETGLSRAERDTQNNDRVLRELAGIPPDRRSARFVCVMALGAPAPFTTCTGAGGVPPPEAAHDALTLRLSGENSGSSPVRQVRRATNRLVHIERPHATYFVTWRLESGSLSTSERSLVLDACLHWHGIRAWFHHGVIMPDHVHILLRPFPDDEGEFPALGSIIHSIKSFTAHRVNRLRGATGKLWQDDYYDEIFSFGVPNSVIEYIHSNPRRAGLTAPGAPYPFDWAEVGHGKVQLATGEVRPPRDIPRGAGRPTLRVVENGIVAIVRGTFEGRIGAVPRGAHGFGYDPLFLVAPEYTRSSAELHPDEKNRLSHRAAAAHLMAAEIQRLSDQLE